MLLVNKSLNSDNSHKSSLSTKLMTTVKIFSPIEFFVFKFVFL